METNTITIVPFLNQLNKFIVNPLITLIFFVAFVIFLFGIFQFIRSANDGKARSDGKKKIVYGLFGMFIMFSAYGLINLVLSTFGLRPPSYTANPPSNP